MISTTFYGVRRHPTARRAFVYLLFLILNALPALADDRPWIGMDIVDSRSETRFVGVAVVRVEDDAPAQHAGIVSGDIVLTMDGIGLASAHDFVCRVLILSPGQRVRLEVLHRGELLCLFVTLEMWPLYIPQTAHSCPLHVSLVMIIGSLGG